MMRAWQHVAGALGSARVEGQQKQQQPEPAPSSDGLAKKTSSLRESSGKAPDGQAGRKGSTLRQARQPTRSIDHRLPEQCERCHHELAAHDAFVAERRQAFDVPVAMFDVVEHRTLSVRCTCGQAHTSAFAPRVTDPVQ
ncbi:MAG: hypothetical protein V4857_10410 [Pseudomonadota bacterium]